MKVTVCGLGPGGEGQLTEASLDAIAAIEHRFLRTTVHPTSHRVNTTHSFDSLYEKADTFDEVYQSISHSLKSAAAQFGHVLYAVPGSPLVLEQSVRYLRDSPSGDEPVEVELLPAVSFLDEIWARLKIDPVDDNVRLVDGHRFASVAAGQTGPLLVAHAHAPWVLSDIKLSVELDDSHSVIVLQRLGTPEEKIFEVRWSDLDRLVEPDHLTSLYIPHVAVPVAYELQRSVELMEQLRSGCPWDQKQTHGSLRAYLIEESYEVIDAIDRVVDAHSDTSEDGASEDGDELGAAYADLEEELGDLWFQILFHAQLATEAGQFSINEVARSLYEKMVARHPHVFLPDANNSADANETSANEVSWEQIKKTQKGRDSALDGIASSLPALAYANKIIGRASRAGAPVDPNVVLPQKGQLQVEGKIDAAAIGRLLMTVVISARAENIEPELALRQAAKEAKQRFQEAERAGSTVNQRWLLSDG